MNSFGHATVASWERDEPRFVFGAMLPDLGMLIGARLAAPADESIAAGVRNHHEVDEIFHALPAFTSWWREAAAQLAELGLRRHAARAASHVAIELLLDGELALDEGHEAGFLAALDAAAVLEDPAWRAEPDRSWRELVERLSRAGVPHHLRDPAVVARRVEGALGRRPRLRLHEEEAVLTARWLRERTFEAPVRSAEVLDELRVGLR